MSLTCNDDRFFPFRKRLQRVSNLLADTCFILRKIDSIIPHHSLEPYMVAATIFFKLQYLNQAGVTLGVSELKTTHNICEYLIKP